MLKNYLKYKKRLSTVVKNYILKLQTMLNNCSDVSNQTQIWRRGRKMRWDGVRWLILLLVAFLVDSNKLSIL